MKSILSAGLVGWPVSHSLSPFIHSLFLKHSGLKGTYKLFPVQPACLAESVAHLMSRNFSGLNVTIPHKKAALKLCGSLSIDASAAGAVNTLVFENGIVRGFNTDVTGFRAMAVSLQAPFYVLGTGGASAAVSVALNNCRPVILSRGEEIPCSDRHLCGTVVNATPLGWRDDDIFPFDIPEGFCFADMNYNPNWIWRNSLCGKARVITGEQMLVEQAAESFRLWTGYTPEEDVKMEILERISENLHENRNYP
jgi:shikimate dehydrogenase